MNLRSHLNHAFQVSWRKLCCKTLFKDMRFLQMLHNGRNITLPKAIVPRIKMLIHALLKYLQTNLIEQNMLPQLEPSRIIALNVVKKMRLDQMMMTMGILDPSLFMQHPQGNLRVRIDDRSSQRFLAIYVTWGSNCRVSSVRWRETSDNVAYKICQLKNCLTNQHPPRQALQSFIFICPKSIQLLQPMIMNHHPN